MEVNRVKRVFLSCQLYSKRHPQGVTNAVTNRNLSALKRMLNFGARQTPPLVERVPFIPMLKENNARKGFFEHEEFPALRSAQPPYLKGFATFGYRMGLNRSAT